MVGIGFVRYVGVPLDQQQRLFRLMWVPYVSAILLVGLSGMLNPINSRLLWQSALPATAGAYSGLLWLRYYIPNRTHPLRITDGIRRGYVWIGFATLAATFFLAVLGRGVTLHR